MLEAPAQQYLCGRAAEALRNTADRCVGQVATGPQRAVGLERDAMLPAGLQQRPPVLNGLNCSWLTTGAMLAAAITSPSSLWLKLETPIERA